MRYGLSDVALAKIKAVIMTFPDVDEAIIYGSRAKGNFKSSSDIDIALKGNKLTLHNLNAIALILDDLLLPQKFDVSIYQQITNQPLLEHIDRVGQRLI